MIELLQTEQYDEFLGRFPAFAELCADARDLEVPVLNLPGAVHMASDTWKNLGVPRSKAQLVAVALAALERIATRFPGHSIAAEARFGAAELLLQEGGLADGEERALALCETIARESPGTLPALRARALLWDRRVLRVGAAWPVPPWTSTAGLTVDLRVASPAPTAVLFWSSSCSPSTDALSHLERLVDREGSRLRLVAVNCDVSKEAGQPAAGLRRASSIRLRIHDQAPEAFVPINGVPRIILIDTDGRVSSGSATMADVESLLR